MSAIRSDEPAGIGIESEMGKARERTTKKRRKSKFRIRYVVQGFFFLLVLGITLNHSLEESGRAIPFLASASVHAICPFGGVESLAELVTTGNTVRQVHMSAPVLMVIVFVLALLAGPVFCGWICPFGSLQEWIGKVGRKIFGRKYNRFIPYKYDKYLRYGRYLMSAWVLYMTWSSAYLWFKAIDPYYALFHLWTGEVAIGGFIALGLVVVGSLFVERPFCKYACPYGAILGLFNKIRIFKIKRADSICINCKLCENRCPMNIPITESENVRNHQCISCLECTSEYACPSGALDLTTGKASTGKASASTEMARRA